MDRWLSDCCTGGFTFFKNTWHEEAVARRQAFLDKWCKPPFDFKPTHFPTSAFRHGYVNIEADWYKDSWGLDPLIIPLLKHMNSVPGIKTFASCQGTHVMSPNVLFGAVDMETIQQLMKSLTRKPYRGCYWNNKVLSPFGKRDGVWTWWLSFYDTLALMELTKDVLGVSYEDQLNPVEIYKVEINYYDGMPPILPPPTVGELLEVLAMKG